MRILIIASRFFMGGFSKSLINFLLCAEKYPELDVTVLTLQKNEIDDYKEIPSRFHYIAIEELTYQEKAKRGINKEYLFNTQRLRNIEYILTELICKISKRPFPYTTMVKFMSFSEADRARRVTTDFAFCEEFDVAISWEELFCNYLLVEKIPAKHKVGYIHPNYKEVGFSKAADKPYLKELDAIVTVSESCRDTLISVYPEYRDKIKYIPNRLNLKRTERNAEEYTAIKEDSVFNLLTVCRMSDHDKAVFRIVDICKRLHDEGVQLKWYLIGNGPDFEELNHRIEKEHLEDVIVCLGQLDNPLPYMKMVDLYVQQSYVEGRPVSVDESLVLNTPALITNYSSAHEQILDNITGWIVDNSEDAIFEMIKKLYNNRELIQNAQESLKNQDKNSYEDCTLMIKLLESLYG